MVPSLTFSSRAIFFVYKIGFSAGIKLCNVINLFSMHKSSAYDERNWNMDYRNGCLGLEHVRHWLSRRVS